MSKISDSMTYDIVYLLQMHGKTVVDALHDQINEIVAKEIDKLESEINELEDLVGGLEQEIEDLVYELSELT